MEIAKLKKLDSFKCLVCKCRPNQTLVVTEQGTILGVYCQRCAEDRVRQIKDEYLEACSMAEGSIAR